MADQPTSLPRRPWRAVLRWRSDETLDQGSIAGTQSKPKWSMGILNDRETIEVPGSVLLLSGERNEPLGLRNAPARTSHSSIAVGILPEPPMGLATDGKKLTKDGRIILEPQPDDSLNDPLNWPVWRRDSALVSLGLFCMVGGGVGPLIAAGFPDVARDLDVDIARVPLTTGLFMLGLGVGSVIFSPTAILYGKRPVYLFGAIIFILSTVWCALSPSFPSLILARIVQGIAVSPVECLPSATIAEIYFLHERAFRIGIYTLLLLGGKNLLPLISAAIIQALSWRWVFWIVAVVVGICGVLLFFFVPETFWDRTPVPKSSRRASQRSGLFSQKSYKHAVTPISQATSDAPGTTAENTQSEPIGEKEVPEQVHVGFAPGVEYQPASETKLGKGHLPRTSIGGISIDALPSPDEKLASSPQNQGDATPETPSSGSALEKDRLSVDYFRDPEVQYTPHGLSSDTDSEKVSSSDFSTVTKGQEYTHKLREAPRRSFRSQLKVHNGRLNEDSWLKIAIRPFILYSYPAVLWSAAVYSCSVGWLLVLSECLAVIYQQGPYKFSPLSTGLVYISPLIGGVLGTAVAGKVSDTIVKMMAQRNGGLYEPEFRLVMAIPIAITTVIGLMGFGWSAGVDDPWIAPTVFFGVISFGCALGSTTAITFCVDSYRQYAGESLVTLNFSKNILHGLPFSFFITSWIQASGSKAVFIWIGVIQLIILLFTIPMYIFGKRARMWTVRMNFMERF
ncbi:major facilitator superfamily domain-containing protein [Xylaria intraflava]|nr:major facilitator superfamily domain-containing protein [Xylaria intraflava]